MCFSINSSFFFFSHRAKKKKNKNTNAHQHAYSRCRLRLSALSATHKRKKKKKILFFFSSNNANDDTTFTSNWLLGSIFLFLVFFFNAQGERKWERKRTSAVNGPSCACSEHTRNERSESSEKKQEKKRALFPVLSYCSAVVCAWGDRTQSLLPYTRSLLLYSPRLPVKPQRVTQCSMKSDYSTFGCISRRRNYNTARWWWWWWWWCWWWWNVL